MEIYILTLFCLVFVLLSPKAESTITSWTSPNISTASGTGTLTISESQTVSTAITIFVAKSDATAVTYVLGSAVSPFTLSTTGVLSIRTNLDADQTASYKLNIVATDNATPPASGTATITVTVTDVDETPKFGSTSYKKCILDNSAIDTTVVTALATDSDPGDTVTHSIASGDTNNDFKIDASTGVIQVAKALSMTKTTTYTLVVHAADNEPTPKTGSTTVTVSVSADCSEKNSATVKGVSVASLVICMLTIIY